MKPVQKVPILAQNEDLDVNVLVEVTHNHL